MVCVPQAVCDQSMPLAEGAGLSESEAEGAAIPASLQAHVLLLVLGMRLDSRCLAWLSA